MGVIDAYLSRSARRHAYADYDDPVHYYVYRCPLCGFTSHRMALFQARQVAGDHEGAHGWPLFAGRIYDAEPRRRWDVDLRLGRWLW